MNKNTAAEPDNIKISSSAHTSHATQMTNRLYKIYITRATIGSAVNTAIYPKGKHKHTHNQNVCIVTMRAGDG